MADGFTDRDWWQALYDDIVAELFLVRQDARQTAATAEFLTRALGLGPGSAVFDQCCGTGTVSLPIPADFPTAEKTSRRPFASK